MKTFRVFTDERISVWQRVGLTIQAENEEEVKKLLSDEKLFMEAMQKWEIEYTGENSPYWETEDNEEFDHSNYEITEITGEK